MIYEKDKMLVVAGPCLLEDESISMRVAEKLAEIQRERSSALKVIFKGSFDKANRTSYRSARSIGLARCLKVFERIKNEFSLSVLTDIHESRQAAEVSELCEVIQIPAFLCRQTDLLLAAAATGKTVNAKKGQFLSPHDMKFVVEKLRWGGAREIWQTERGTTFGYNNLVVDMRSFFIMQKTCRPCLMDVTHSLQMPGPGAGVTSGDRQYAEPLARAALAAGADGLFIETHPDPDKALSDAATQLPLGTIETFLDRCLCIWANR
jgi:2-dehydro-3-deoxyphosphooctonate aldolase (KDO 8-P synthase)